jgi:hypothetical protein
VRDEDVGDRGPRLQGRDGLLAHGCRASPKRFATPGSRGATAAVTT